jgi:hypothetical protein
MSNSNFRRIDKRGRKVAKRTRNSPKLAKATLKRSHLLPISPTMTKMTKVVIDSPQNVRRIENLKKKGPYGRGSSPQTSVVNDCYLSVTA